MPWSPWECGEGVVAFFVLLPAATQRNRTLLRGCLKMHIAAWSVPHRAGIKPAPTLQTATG